MTIDNGRNISAFMIFGLPGPGGFNSFRAPIESGPFDIEEQDIMTFVSAAVKSVWSLELLIRLRQGADRVWQKEELVRELRASIQVIDQSLENLEAIGLAAMREGGGWQYSPASPMLDDFAEGAQRLYREKPFAVINAIAAARNDKLRIFADAFRLKD